MIEKNPTREYVERWFVSLQTLAKMAGLPVSECQSLIKASAAPGPIYCFSSVDGWWSALAAYVGKAPSAPPIDSLKWYAPSSVWWLRRAILNMRNGATVSDAAKLNEQKFCADFASIVRRIAFAEYAYPQCFQHGQPDEDAIAKTAASEWNAWAGGAYGVCLRFFSAESCIKKEALAARIKAHMAASEASPEKMEEDALFSLCEELASLVLPFAPSERNAGTPGQALDRPLLNMRLGEELPYGEEYGE